MRYVVLFFIILSLLVTDTEAQSISLIRDAETENFLYDLTKPIFKAAGLNPDDITIYIVNDSSLNSFVSGGQNVFINTGLIEKYTDPDVLIGVIAHESGHIAAGHLARSSEDIKSAENALIASYILGIAAAVASKPDAGMALIMGGSQVANRSAITFTRGQEESADLLALKSLDKLNYSADGLLELLEYFGTEENPYLKQIDEYALTHPISEKRINFIKAHNQKLAGKKPQRVFPELQKRLTRISIKLIAFLGDPDDILRSYNKNTSLDKYASAIAYYRKGNIKEAINLLDDLIKINLNDGYLYDLKGQILFEHGNLVEAVVAYDKAIKLNNNNDLARIALASAIINLNTNDKNLIDLAIGNLITALRSEKYDPNIYRQLSIAYNQNNDLGRSYLALAEYNLMNEDKKRADKYAKLAKDNLDKNDKADLLRADDVIDSAKKIKDEKERK